MDLLPNDLEKNPRFQNLPADDITSIKEGIKYFLYRHFLVFLWRKKWATSKINHDGNIKLKKNIQIVLHNIAVLFFSELVSGNSILWECFLSEIV